MEQALPVAVRFLNKENKEMSRNLASYLSLAAIEYTNLLVPYIDIILRSLLYGNYSLARVILQLFELSNEAAIITKIRNIIDILPKCEMIDKNILLQLIANIIHSNSTSEVLIIDKLPQIFDLILNASTAQQALLVLLRLAEKKPSIFHEYIGLFILSAQKNPSTICIVGQILAAIGRRNKEKAHIALEFIMENLPRTDRASQTTLLQEAVKLCSQYPILFNDKLTAVIRQRNLSQQSLLNNNNAQKSNPQLTSGNITIVNLNSSTTLPPPPRSSSTISTSNMPLKSQQISVNSVTSTNNIHPSNGLTASQHQQQQPYIRRPKFDSRSTGRLSGAISNNRSMTRLNVAQTAVNNSSNLGGLHKSMTRLSSSQQINQANAFASNNIDATSFIPATIPPPLSSNVIVTGENKWGIPSTKITSGGVTALHHTATNRIRPFSQGPATLLGSIGNASSSNGLSTLNQSTGSISMHNNIVHNISVHHAMPLVLTQPSTSSLASPPVPPVATHDSLGNSNNQVVISGPTTVTSRKSANSNNKSVTLLNVNSVNHRMSVFEPNVRDTIQHFCEKHLDKIKNYMKTVLHKLPPAAKCTIEERRSKKFAKLHFACQARQISQCLYSKTFFSMKTRFPGTWIHLMFLDLQSRSDHALSSYDPSVSSLKHCWDTLKVENKTFITLVTSGE
jgi:protein melted